jgi:hypothetical protein
MTPARVAAAAPVRIVATPRPKPYSSKPPIAKMVAKMATALPSAAASATPTVVSNAIVAGDDRATSVVRAYLDALAHGDRTAAASYLATGTPSETFMNTDSRIESIRSSNVGPQEYRVTADVQTGSGEYYITFTVEQNPSGFEITDHYSIKPQ